jgi:hypothetical protein
VSGPELAVLALFALTVLIGAPLGWALLADAMDAASTARADALTRAAGRPPESGSGPNPPPDNPPPLPAPPGPAGATPSDVDPARRSVAA